ncbi:potassium transporter TrkH [Pyxidicoccus xibeiensis]|uniref:potassium transporter TrkH n=1 Tax=Pyxidicoccus xibeiensis TaxID=2906759 RepID=UPI0020A7BD15|nr:potassium transporter TrkH [Pyxidicoccus xibeiensis]MCP3144283.1 potassium transporter TrkH [Pyxidicoccus xibeiensis]
MRLRFGDWGVEVDARLLSRTAERCTLAPFESPEAPVHLSVRVGGVPAGEGGPLDPRRPAGPRFALQGDTVLVEPPADALDTELALRVALQLATLRQGGLLLHAGGVAFGTAGVVALGPSGAGKSTFTRLCAGAGAKVLSDEVIALYPDGHVEGSPFCSDLDLPSALPRARLAALLLLEKGDAERLALVPAREALAALAGQVFRPLLGEVTPADVLQRLSALLERTAARKLTFRKDPAVAGFVEEWVHAAAEATLH